MHSLGGECMCNVFLKKSKKEKRAGRGVIVPRTLPDLVKNLAAGRARQKEKRLLIQPGAAAAGLPSPSPDLQAQAGGCFFPTRVCLFHLVVLASPLHYRQSVSKRSSRPDTPARC